MQLLQQYGVWSNHLCSSVCNIVFKETSFEKMNYWDFKMAIWRVQDFSSGAGVLGV